MTKHSVIKDSGIFPFVLCGGLIVLSVLLVILGHRQGDALALTNAAATATASAAKATPSAVSSSAVLVTNPSSSATAAAASALAKPAAAD